MLSSFSSLHLDFRTTAVGPVTCREIGIYTFFPDTRRFLARVKPTFKFSAFGLCSICQFFGYLDGHASGSPFCTVRSYFVLQTYGHSFLFVVTFWTERCDSALRM